MYRALKFLYIILMSTGLCFWSSGSALHAQFIDVTDLHGIDNINEGTFDGNGLSFHDFNRDGWDDLTLANGADEPQFYVNNNGSLELTELNILVEPTAHVVSVLWVDYDNDGDSDLFTSELGGRIHLWNNDGDLNFTDASVAAGISQEMRQWWAGSFCDYDHDGDLDFYITAYYDSLNDFDPDHESLLYQNDGDGTFTDVTQASGVKLPPQAMFQAVWFDYDNDGWEDLFLVIDRVVWINRLFKNNGDGTFTDVSVAAGADQAINSMTGTMGDFDNDLDFDLYVTDGPYSNILLENLGDGTFSEIASAAGVLVDETSWGSLWIDYDNDCLQDLFVGTVGSFFGAEQNHFYKNMGDQIFIEWIDEVGLMGDNSATFTVAMGDINNDGYYDFATNNNDPMPSKLWLNEGGENNYLSIELEGTIANRDGIGSLITCYVGEETFVRFTHCGEDLAGQCSKKEIFGLGDYNQVDSLSVRWNTGNIDWHTNLLVNHRYNLVEGQQLCDFDECSCPGDYTNDGAIDVSDMLVFLTEFGCVEGCGTDLTDDGVIDSSDLLYFLTYFGGLCP